MSQDAGDGTRISINDCYKVLPLGYTSLKFSEKDGGMEVGMSSLYNKFFILHAG
jgi:hypothetical protein